MLSIDATDNGLASAMGKNIRRCNSQLKKSAGTLYEASYHIQQLLNMKLHSPTSLTSIRKRLQPSRKRMKANQNKRKLRPGPRGFTEGERAHVGRQVPVSAGGRARRAFGTRPVHLPRVTAVGTVVAMVTNGFRPEVEVGVLGGARCPGKRESVMALPF